MISVDVNSFNSEKECSFDGDCLLTGKRKTRPESSWFIPVTKPVAHKHAKPR